MTTDNIKIFGDLDEARDALDEAQSAIKEAEGSGVADAYEQFLEPLALGVNEGNINADDAENLYRLLTYQVDSKFPYGIGQIEGVYNRHIIEAKDAKTTPLEVWLETNATRVIKWESPDTNVDSELIWHFRIDGDTVPVRTERQQFNWVILRKLLIDVDYSLVEEVGLPSEHLRDSNDWYDWMAEFLSENVTVEVADGKRDQCIAELRSRLSGTEAVISLDELTSAYTAYVDEDNPDVVYVPSAFIDEVTDSFDLTRRALQSELDARCEIDVNGGVAKSFTMPSGAPEQFWELPRSFADVIVAKDDDEDAASEAVINRAVAGGDSE